MSTAGQSTCTRTRRLSSNHNDTLDVRGERGYLLVKRTGIGRYEVYWDRSVRFLAGGCG